MRLNTTTSALTETNILYTNRHTDGRTEKLIPEYPRKHLGISIAICYLLNRLPYKAQYITVFADIVDKV